MSQESDRQDVFYTYKDLTSDYYQAIIAKGRPKWCKFIWLFLTLAFLGTTVYLVATLVKNYLQFNAFNQVSVKWQSSLALPAITICSTNFINYTDFQEQIPENMTKDLKDFLTELAYYNGSLGAENIVDAEDIKMFDAALQNKYGEEVSFFEDFQFEPEFFMLGDGYNHYRAKFAEKWMKLDLGFESIDAEEDLEINLEEETEEQRRRRAKNIGPHKYGSCIVLNDDESMVQRLGGPQGGFTIDLDARVSDYLPATKTKGFMVYLRNPNETLLVDQGGILVSPGTETFIAVSKSEVTRLEPRFGDCKNISSKFVPSISGSVRECIQEMQLNITVNKCLCIPWYLSEKLDQLNLTAYKNEWEYSLEEVEDGGLGHTCGFATQSLCDILVIEELVKKTGNNAANCPEPCYFEEYDWNVNVGDFPPTEAYYKLMLKDRVLIDDETQDNYHYAKENFVRIHIYYEDLKVTQKQQKKAYEIFNFIAELGGTVDMMIGFSFFTLFQTVEIFIVWFCCRSCGRRRPISSRIDGQAMENQARKDDGL
ncbi:hypothetical protein ACHWQZ_G015052 [Mnemiopsis leidyi]